MTILEIKNKIKNNDYIRFYVRDYDEASHLEDILLKHGYKWGGSIVYKMDNIISYTDYIISINHSSDYGHSSPKMILYSSNSVTITNDTVLVSKFTNKELNSLFINEPTYKPKKIERII